MAQRHGVGGRERDDVGVRGEQVVRQARRPRHPARLLGELEVPVGAMTFRANNWSATVDPPVHQAEAEHIDDQHPEACEQQFTAAVLHPSQHRDEKQRGVENTGEHQKREVGRDPSLDPVGSQPGEAHDDQRGRGADDLDRRNDPLGAQGHFVGQKHLDPRDDQHHGGDLVRGSGLDLIPGRHVADRGLIAHVAMMLTIR